MVNAQIDQLLDYALNKKLIAQDDIVFFRNKLLSLFKINNYQPSYQHRGNVEPKPIELILEELLSYAVDNSLIEDSISQTDMLDTAVMGILTPLPSAVNKKFWQLHKESSKKAATDYFYQLCKDCNYIRTSRIEKDQKWTTMTEYGTLEITINLSKPEKDPKDIANAKSQPQSDYPRCLLCVENEGFAGTLTKPARQNLRVVPLCLHHQGWGLQYSPYSYYDEHCIILNRTHTPMKIDCSVFSKLLSFVEQFPHYFAGSNADLPIVGGSILTHEHFQGGRHTFAMEKAEIKKPFSLSQFPQVKAGVVNWPMTVLRISHPSVQMLVNTASHILRQWQNYTDESANIIAFTDGAPHNTITPIARKRGESFELDLVLRNNRTTEHYPMGIFHPHEELHNIKKENIGLIEVMGLAVLPARLQTELKTVKQALLENTPLEKSPLTQKHAHWVSTWKNKYESLKEENIDYILQQEVGNTFKTVLEHAGVFKQNKDGEKALNKFMVGLL